MSSQPVRPVKSIQPRLTLEHLAYAFGSYLIWAAQPEYPVFVDTRLELYPMDFWRDYLDISAVREGWQAKLDRQDVKTLLSILLKLPGVFWYFVWILSAPFALIGYLLLRWRVGDRLTPYGKATG